jgi:two-component system NtrC family sensor kinase
MLDLTSFTLKDMANLEAALRRIGAGAESMQEVASRIVRHLHGGLVDRRSGKGSCALVRLFKTHRQGDLPPELREGVGAAADGAAVTREMKCLVLLATAGDEPAWNSTALSVGHKVIPIASPSAVAKVPMLVDLFRQLGIESALESLPESGILIEPEQKTFNVFYVPVARGRPEMLQEDFVLPFHIESVLGVGGMLPSGELFALVMFSKIPIPRATADLFAPLALSVKLALLRFDGGQVFAERPEMPRTGA